MDSLVVMRTHVSKVDSTMPFFHHDERAAVALLMSQNGFGEVGFWRLYYFLRQHKISFLEFLFSKNLAFFPIHNNIAESIHKIKKEYKNTNYIEQLADQQISVIFCTDEVYPPLLKTIDLPPPLLYGKGRPINTEKSLAVVGSRQMTMYGKLVITSWLPEFIRSEVPIISGAVQGVDHTTQQLALDYGGQTIAVLGHGLAGSTSYSQQRLLADWEAAGAWLISCFAPTVHPSKGTFLARNRIVAGMSRAVLVIEAAQKSGTMHTATWAAEFGRPLLAVPGSVFNQFSDGTAALVNQGACLVTSAAEVLSQLDDCSKPPRSSSEVVDDTQELTAPEQAVWELIRAGEIQLQALLAKLLPRFSLSEVLAAVTSLELHNRVVQKQGWLLAGKQSNK